MGSGLFLLEAGGPSGLLALVRFQSIALRSHASSARSLQLAP